MNQEPVLIKGVVAFPNPNGNREIRFIDAFYHDLFKIPDHSNIVISYLDGGKRCVPCEYIDDTHVDIDGTAFHICQFAELMMRNGATYEPEHPPAEPTYGTYEIYQIKDVGRVDYCFMEYERAKKQFDPNDYRREYAYMLPKDMTLEEVFSRHNADTRPFSMRMRSMSVSDVLVVDRGGKKTAYYVDSFGFQEVKQFFKQKGPKKNTRPISKKRTEPER